MVYEHLMLLIDFKEKTVFNLVPIKIQTKAKNSNTFCISYSTKAAKVTKNSTVLLLVFILLSLWALGSSHPPDHITGSIVIYIYRCRYAILGSIPCKH